MRHTLILCSDWAWLKRVSWNVTKHQEIQTIHKWPVMGGVFLVWFTQQPSSQMIKIAYHTNSLHKIWKWNSMAFSDKVRVFYGQFLVLTLSFTSWKGNWPVTSWVNLPGNHKDYKRNIWKLQRINTSNRGSSLRKCTINFHEQGCTWKVD